jgi:NADH pyrophosphatase NudC (nudix superfamily)
MMGWFDEITGLFKDRDNLVAEDNASIAFALQQAKDKDKDVAFTTLQQIMESGHYDVVQGIYNTKTNDLVSTQTDNECPKCHAAADKDAQFCAKCGAKLNDVMTGKECPKCHTSFDKDAQFCAKCGTKLEPVYA